MEGEIFPQGGGSIGPTPVSPTPPTFTGETLTYNGTQWAPQADLKLGAGFVTWGSGGNFTNVAGAGNLRFKNTQGSLVVRNVGNTADLYLIGGVDGSNVGYLGADVANTAANRVTSLAYVAATDHQFKIAGATQATIANGSVTYATGMHLDFDAAASVPGAGALRFPKKTTVGSLNVFLAAKDTDDKDVYLFSGSPGTRIWVGGNNANGTYVGGASEIEIAAGRVLFSNINTTTGAGSPYVSVNGALTGAAGAGWLELMNQAQLRLAESGCATVGYIRAPANLNPILASRNNANGADIAILGFSLVTADKLLIGTTSAGGSRPSGIDYDTATGTAHALKVNGTAVLTAAAGSIDVGADLTLGAGLDIKMANNRAIYMKDSGGTYQEILQYNASNQIEIGGSVYAPGLTAAYACMVQTAGTMTGTGAANFADIQTWDSETVTAVGVTVSTANGTLAVTAAGKYRVFLSGQVSMSGACDVLVKLLLNGGAVNGGTTRMQCGGSNFYAALPMEVILNLAASDSLKLQLACDNTLVATLGAASYGLKFGVQRVA